MNTPRTATVEGFGQAKNSRALAYLTARSWVGKIEGRALVMDIPATVSDRQAIDFMWHAFNFPQTLDGWCVITPKADADKMRAKVQEFAAILETEGDFVSARVFRELADLPDESMITLQRALSAAS